MDLGAEPSRLSSVPPMGGGGGLDAGLAFSFAYYTTSEVWHVHPYRTYPVPGPVRLIYASCGPLHSEGLSLDFSL